VQAASGKTAQAKETLKGVLAKATKWGYIGYQLEARLTLLEVELRAGKTSASVTALEQLQKDAKDKGFDLIARKADALGK
jgi:hypothetical protein